MRFCHTLFWLLASVRNHVVLRATEKVASHLPQDRVRWLKRAHPERQEGPVTEDKRENVWDIGLNNVDEDDQGEDDENRSGHSDKNVRSSHRQSQNTSGQEEEHEDQVGDSKPSVGKNETLKTKLLQLFGNTVHQTGNNNHLPVSMFIRR